MIYGYNNGKSACECICDCGNKKIVDTYELKIGKIKSCGCLSNYYRSINNKNNNVGQKYGRLTIIEEEFLNGKWYAIANCCCGNKIKALKADIVNLHTQSCGCLQRERTSNANKKDYSNTISLNGIKILNKSRKNKYGTWMYNCQCPICFKEFECIPAKINNGHTTSCGCRKQSSREVYIEEILKENNVEYKREVSFNNCENIKKLRFDFGIYQDGELIYLIEYDGRQHFKPIEYFGGNKNFENQTHRDKIKTKYCCDNNIFLLRLSYKDSLKDIKEKITCLINA